MSKNARWGTVAVFTAITLISGGVGVLAQADKEAIVKNRQAHMKLQGTKLGDAVKYSKGEVDQATAIASVTELLTLEGKISELFPPGTGMAEFPGKSGAKPAIWADFKKFTATIPTVRAETEKLLAALRSGDKAAVAQQARATWDEGCQVCHRPYREEL
jgi:cytochrome c556